MEDGDGASKGDVAAGSVDALLREQRVHEAADLARSQGDAARASELFERACEFGDAAKSALDAGDAGRALSLAVVARDDAIASSALAKLAAERPRELLTLARELELRGDYAWAARVHEARIGRGEAAASSEAERAAANAWARAGDAVRAASLFERAAEPVDAAKALEAAARRDPMNARVHVALGDLLTRYGKYDAAVRALQRVPPGSPARRRALPPLVRALEALGLTQAAEEASSELATLGGPEDAESPSTPADVQQRMYGRYEVVREVASTATSRVLECVDTVRGERVAVKVLASWNARGSGRDALARFEREVRVLGALDHPNIVPLRDFVPDGPAMVLAWMSGGTLDDKMQSPLAPARAVEIADAVLRALGEAHRLGVLHRDVKPSNVLFDDAGVARLSDFGVAHLGDLSVTATAAVIGTLAYMSPEQREGKPATVRSDVYGAGAILFEMLTGERLVAGEAPKTRPSGVHRELDARHDAAVMQMLAPLADDRPPDTFAARRALSALAWPKDVERAAPRPRAPRREAERPSAARLKELDGDDEVATTTDTWTGRRVERVPLTPESLARAAAFACAGHEALQLVLRVDRGAGFLWLEAPPEGRLDRTLTPGERDELLAALDALHAHGAVHGHVDREHVAVAPGLGARLLFAPASDPTATADTDFAQLRRLSST